MGFVVGSHTASLLQPILLHRVVALCRAAAISTAMTRATTRRVLSFLTLACAAVTVTLGVGGGTAWAHNSLTSSDPADGSTLASAPTQITFVFDKPAPLDTLTVTLIDATGARTDLPGSVHGPNGETEVVTPLPALSAGAISVRWKLVGPDGHPISGRVGFTIAAPAGAPPTTAAGAVPPTTVAPPQPAEPAATDDTPVPSAARWLLRYGSYAAIMTAVGTLMTTAFVWGGAAQLPLLRRLLNRSLLATAVLGALQLLVVASDISGDSPWSAFGSIDRALTTDAGAALLIRIAVALAVWRLLAMHRTAHPDVYWTSISLSGLGLLATWAFAGHSRSQRWPAVGVITDVAHHAAAAAWIAGLAIVALVVIPRADTGAAGTVRRFSRVAAVSVGVLVVTGLAQTIRLVGSPMALLDAAHGRMLAVKLALLAAMLFLANANRRRVATALDEMSDHHTVGPLRSAMLAEFALGAAIVAVTAAMVVSPPSSSAAEHHRLEPAVYTT
jgi:copper transport protein